MLDRAALRNADRDTYGAAALHGLDPSEIVCRMEESELDPLPGMLREREALRREIFAGAIEYFFCDGPAPEAVRERVGGFVGSMAPDAAARITGEIDWITPCQVREILRRPAYLRRLRALRATQRPGNLYDWDEELKRERDAECVSATIVEIVGVLLSQGTAWRQVIAVCYTLAKAFHSHLIAGMSLEDIARLSGDAGRATPSHRGKRLYNHRLEAAGALGTSLPYQKSASVVAKYAEAQRGNTNRAAKRPKHHRSPKS